MNNFATTEQEDYICYYYTERVISATNVHVGLYLLLEYMGAEIRYYSKGLIKCVTSVQAGLNLINCTGGLNLLNYTGGLNLLQLYRLDYTYNTYSGGLNILQLYRWNKSSTTIQVD